MTSRKGDGIDHSDGATSLYLCLAKKQQVIRPKATYKIMQRIYMSTHDSKAAFTDSDSVS